MKKALFTRLAALGCTAALCAALAGCGSSSAASTTAIADVTDNYNTYSSPEANVGNSAAGGAGPASDGGSLGNVQSSLTPEQATDSKIIYNATVQMESTAFEDARAALMAAVDDCGGYLEYSNLSGSAEEANRYASYTVRVPVEKYRSFLEAIGQAGSVLSLSESAQNITSNYIDVQARLTALQAQRDRLNALADTAETTADLLEIESQLSDVQYELENYTQQMRSMDSQVAYSTVDLYLDEVATLTPTGTSFGERLSAAFTGGWQAFVSFVQWLVLALVYLLPLLVLLGVAAVAWRLSAPARKARRAARKPARPAAPAVYDKPAAPGETPDEKPGDKPKYQ